MKTWVEFRFGKFPACDGEEEEIKPGLWGKRLAEYIEQKLNAMGIETEGIDGEDWGYIVWVKNEEFKLQICCGHQNGDDDEFLCFIKPNESVIQKLFKKIDTREQVGRLSAALEKIFSSDPEIREIRWQDEEAVKN
jgi:hypothetical protein